MLALAGAEVLCVPSDFTERTGRDHWEPLLRARAIENGAYVIAPAQCGVPPAGNPAYGHSLVVDPWGIVVAQASEGPGVVLHRGAGSADANAQRRSGCDGIDTEEIAGCGQDCKCESDGRTREREVGMRL